MISPMLMQGIGAGMSGIGGVAESIGNMKSKNKARKARIAGLQNAKNEFTLGSQDTQGNQINFNNKRGWGFDLSRAGKSEVTNANRQSYLANAMAAKLPSEYKNQQTASDYRAYQQQARANQSAANRMALRGNGNVGNIARSFGQAGSSALQNAMLQNAKSGAALQQNAINNYIANAQNAKNLTNQTMQNLLSMQNGPASQQLALNQAIAEAQAVPKTNWLQTGGKSLQGIGQGMANFGQGMQNQQNLQNLQALQQQNFDKYLAMLQALMKGGA